MKNKSKFKWILAKEILFFFSAIGIVALIWGFLFIRNSFFELKVKSGSAKVLSLQNKLDTLPEDYVSDFYNLTNRYYVVKFKIGDEVFAIPKEQETDFLNDNINIQKDLVNIPISQVGYSYYKFNYLFIEPETTISYSTKLDLSKKIKNLYSEYATIDDITLADKILKKFLKLTDSTIVFDFVSIDKFRDFISSEDYQENLYTVFANNSDNDEWTSAEILQQWSLPEVLHPEFDPMKPYNELFNLGTLSDFKAKLNKSRRYKQTVFEEKEKIETEIESQQDLISGSKNSLISTDDIYDILFSILVVIGILLYPMRLSILIILWAVKTIKQKP